MIIFTTGSTPRASAHHKDVDKHCLYEKAQLIDFNAERFLRAMTDKKLRAFDFVISVASSGQTNNEINDYREIAIWKTA